MRVFYFLVLFFFFLLNSSLKRVPAVMDTGNDRIGSSVENVEILVDLVREYYAHGPVERLSGILYPIL